MVAQLALTRPHSNSAATLHHFDTLRITGCSESEQNVALLCQRLQRDHFMYFQKVLILVGNFKSIDAIEIIFFYYLIA
jgi:hypothetical protein